MAQNLFLSTLSLRRATKGAKTIPFGQKNFYPRSPCGERRQPHVFIGQGKSISIHALLAESDVMLQRFCNPCNISIHALLAESDKVPRRAAKAIKYFYPRSPCGERRLRRHWHGKPARISIHALLAESDLLGPCRCRTRAIFLSTLSLRRATTNVPIS